MKHKISTPFGTTSMYRRIPGPNAERVLAIPGYSETLAHNKQLVDALADEGFDAFSFSQPRRRASHRDPMLRQGEVISAQLDSVLRPEEQVHAIAHSLGAAAILKAAQRNPERFRSITLMQPAGLAGEQKLPEQVRRVSKKAAKNQMEATRGQKPKKSPTEEYQASADRESRARYFARVARAQSRSVGVLAKNPNLAFKEARAAGRYDMAKDIAKVVELGIPVHIVTAHSDELFGQAINDAGYETIANLPVSYSSVADHNARHDTFWLQPKRSARIVKQISK